jgi:hypothetical protein
MNAHRVGQVLKFQTLLHGHSISLHDFTRIGAEIVDPQDIFLLRFINDYLGKGSGMALGQGPLERQKFAVVDFNAICAKFLNGVIFRQADAGILNGGKDGGADVDVIHGFFGATKQATSQGNAGLNGNRCQFGAALNEIQQE